MFERLIEKSPIPEHLVLLSGRLTMIPASLLGPKAGDIETEGVKTRPLSEDDRFLVLDGPLNRLARGLTHLLLDGHLRTLAGTRTLLGEGWDAPVINSLKLATSVGSVMLTNQMRGRPWAVCSLISCRPIFRGTSAYLFGLWALGTGLAGVLLYQWKTTLKIVRAFLMHLPVDGALFQIAEALKTALCETGLIETAESQLTIRLQPNSDGTFQIALEGGTFYELSLFADCFAELLAPIENPRFMLRRQGWLYGMSRDDYRAVPLAFGLEQERVEPLCRAFEAKVGPVELVNCWTTEGQAHLLKARMKAFSATFRRDMKRQDRWQ